MGKAEKSVEELVTKIERGEIRLLAVGRGEGDRRRRLALVAAVDRADPLGVIGSVRGCSGAFAVNSGVCLLARLLGRIAAGDSKRQRGKDREKRDRRAQDRLQ